ncbi:hypothetical protein [Ruminiclostridium papyrosolvens]|uniref:hypothetical protein n=1 Tax=Ruminiclostridium papyrosolvens TaxID=29362 RepID=UPI0001B26275
MLITKAMSFDRDSWYGIFTFEGNIYNPKQLDFTVSSTEKINLKISLDKVKGYFNYNDIGPTVSKLTRRIIQELLSDKRQAVQKCLHEFYMLHLRSEVIQPIQSGSFTVTMPCSNLLLIPQVLFSLIERLSSCLE